MSKNGSEFPFATVLDLSILVDFWREAANDPENRWHTTAASVIERVRDVPELNGPIDDPVRLTAVQGGVEALMSAFRSPASKGMYAAAMVPWELTPVYMTEWARQAELPARMREHFDKTYTPEEMFVGMAMKAYGLILEEVYGLRFGFELPFSWISFRDVESTVPVKCPTSGIVRRFAIDFDTRFLKVEVVGERPEIAPEELAPLAGDLNALPRLLEVLPPDRFAFRGITVMFASDVTAEAALTAIRDDLLVKDALTSREGILHLQEHVRAFMGDAELELGLIAVERGDDVDAVVGGRPIGRSLLMSEGEAPVCPERAESLYAKSLSSSEPLIVEDITCCSTQTGLEYHLKQQGLRGLMIQPLHVDGTLVGVLELASPTPGALNRVNVFKLEKIQGIFALGLQRSVEEEEDRVQAIIKQDYTAIHPVVEWRFRQAAREILRNQQQGEGEKVEEIVFSDLIPLYGLTDIRGSSSLRNQAIASDLKDQLDLAKSVIRTAQSARPQPALGELEFRLDRYLDSLHPGMATEDETSVLDYLQRQIEPLFGELVPIDSDVADRVREYREALDPTLGILYRKRKAFERSVAMVNETIAAVLRDQQGHAQALVPHYFELFKTDGVDYNVYVGDSLTESGADDPLDLRNLRLWQLITTCRIAWALEEIQGSLEVPLAATHLILVQNTPLAIRFRRDERRFDVDGAYNIRYEIVKKRIDKAYVRGTEERLTQPGTIAIAYSQEREAEEYRRYLEYLQSSGFIEEGIETLELEDLQGVFGLKALRVKIQSRVDETSRDGKQTAIEPPESRLSIEA